MKHLKKSIFFLFGFSIMALVLEFFFSIAGVLNPIVEIDATRGERYIPNKISNSLFVMEGFGLSRTNRDGWFGKDYHPPSAGENAIGIIGNSYVAARQVFERDNFLSIAEGELNKNLTSSKATFYNFGSEGMTIEQLLYAKEWILKKYKLSFAVVLLNKRSFEPISRMMPHYDLLNDSLQLNGTFTKSDKYKLYRKFDWFKRSSLLFLGYRVKNQLARAPEIIFDKFYPTTNNGSPEQSENGNTIGNSEIAILTELVKDSRLFFLLDLPENENEIVKKLVPQARTIDLRPTLTVLKEIQGIDPNHFKINNQKGHWNHDAHSVVGIKLAKEIRLLIEKDTVLH